MRITLLAMALLAPVPVAAGCLDEGRSIVLAAGADVTPKPGDVVDMRKLSAPQIQIRNANNVCVTGGNIVGTIPRDMGWVAAHAGFGDGVGFLRATGPIVVENTKIENVADAIGPPKDPEGPRTVSFIIRGVYAKYIRDDFLEDDAAYPGLIEDSLIDGTHVFISARPSRGVAVNFPAAVITVRNTLVRLDCKPDARADLQDVEPPRGPTPKAGDSCGPDKSLAAPFKWSPDASKLTVDISNTIIRIDDAGRNGPGSMDFPPGKYRDVTLIWLGPGNYPSKLPASGVTVTRDVAVWDKARQAWLDARNPPSPPPEPPPPPAELAACQFGLTTTNQGLVVEANNRPCAVR